MTTSNEIADGYNAHRSISNPAPAPFSENNPFFGPPKQNLTVWYSVGFFWHFIRH